MGEVVLDECLYYLREAENFLSMYHEIDPYEEIFEAYKPDVQLQVAQNEKAKTGVMGSLTKACQAVLNIIRNLIDSIKNFFAKRNLDAETREAYEAFKKKCAEDPTTKNKKITVMDFKKINGEYNQILSEAEKADKELAQGRELNLDNIFSKISGFCGDVVKGAGVAIGMEAALNMASSSQEIAKKIYESLQSDKALEDNLIKAVGKHETKKFESQMKSLSKRISLHRQIMKMKGTYSKSIEEAIDHTFSTVWDVVGHAKNIAKTREGVDPELAVKGNALQRAAGNVSYLGKNFGTLVKDGGGALIKGGGLAKRLYGNETIRSTIKDTMKSNSESTKEARKMYRQEIKDEKKRAKAAKKKKPLHAQSAMDSLLAKHDPDSMTRKVVSKYRKDGGEPDRKSPIHFSDDIKD